MYLFILTKLNYDKYFFRYIPRYEHKQKVQNRTNTMSRMATQTGTVPEIKLTINNNRIEWKYHLLIQNTHDIVYYLLIIIIHSTRKHK